MGIVFDFVIIFIAVSMIIMATKRGFVKSLMSLLSVIAAAVAAYAFTPLLSEFIKGRWLLPSIKNGISGTISSLAGGDAGNADILSLFENMPKAFTDILSRYGAEADALREQLGDTINTGGSAAVDALSEAIASPVASMIASSISYIAIFFAVMIVLALLTMVLNVIFTLPVLNGANRLAGFILGIFMAVITAFILSKTFVVLSVALGSIDSGVFGEKAVENTFIIKNLNNIGVFDIINNVLK